MKRHTNGETYVVCPGDYFNILLPDGTMFNVEQTADDFSIVHFRTGQVVYTNPTSVYAKENDKTPTETPRKVRDK